MKILSRASYVLLYVLLLIAAGVSLTACGSPEAEFNVHAYDKKFRARFLPAFPVLAKEIIDYTKVTKGTCVDIGCGPGYLSLALARITGMKIYSLDISAPAVAMAKKYAEQEGLSGRMIPVQGDVHSMPFPDSSADLVVSRGSIPFWKDRGKAFGEIKRILKPGGFACVGCGFGSGYRAIKKPVSNPRRGKPPKKFSHDSVIAALESADIQDYTVIDDNNRGYWVIIRKQ